MSNRKKPKNRKLIAEQALHKVNVPDDELVVLKRVPAKIKWADVDAIERNDEEIIGEAIIYDNGSQDVVIFEGISEDAKKLVYGIRGGVDHFSIADPSPN